VGYGVDQTTTPPSLERRYSGKTVLIYLRGCGRDLTRLLPQAGLCRATSSVVTIVHVHSLDRKHHAHCFGPGDRARLVQNAAFWRSAFSKFFQHPAITRRLHHVSHRRRAVSENISHHHHVVIASATAAAQTGRFRGKCRQRPGRVQAGRFGIERGSQRGVTSQGEIGLVMS